MLSIDLFDSRYERKLHEGAVDDAEYARLKKLGEKIDYLKQARAKTNDPEMRRAIDGRIKQYDDERKEILSVRGMKEAEQPTQRPSPQDPFAYVKPEPKGIGDIQDPKTKMAQLQQKAKKGPLANVGAGLKGFLTGKEEPLDEQEPTQSPRAFGVANFQRLVKANMGNYPKLEFEFANARENITLDKHGIDLISDYYDGLENDQAKNFFIYRVLPSAAETRKVLKSIGYQEQRQQELPGIPTQGELPLSEVDQKKKSDKDDLKAGDVKTAREIEKIRARYPAARSDIEALARAEIDSSEQSQQQIGRIRSANSRQDELLKQIMNIDREQSQEIDTLDSEKDSIEAQLDRVQSLNDRLTQAVAQMSGTKTAKDTTKTSTTPAAAPDRVIDLIPGAPADRAEPAKSAAITRPVVAPAPAPAPRPEPDVVGSMARTIQSLPKDAPDTAKDAEKIDQEPEEKPVSSLKSLRPKQAANVDDFRLTGTEESLQEGVPQDAIQRYLAIDAETDVEAVKKAIQAIHRDPALSAKSKARLLSYIFALVRKHRLHIGRAYYQFLQQYLEEGWSDKYNPTPYAVYIDGRQWKTFRTNDEARAVADKVQANLKRQGRKQTVTIATSKDVKETFDMPGTTIPRKSLIQGYTVYFNPETRVVSVTRGGDSEEAAIEQARLGTVNMKTFRQAAERMIDRIEELAEAKEIITKKDFLDRRDYLLRKIEADPNPVNKQIIRAEIRKLESQAEAEGWLTAAQRLVREDSSTSSEAAERAILHRIMVDDKLRNMAMDVGMDKVLQAVEDVAYNVGDLDDLGSSDVSGWVKQVKQILGVPEELDEKWSAKYKRSINCARPRGFSQRAHCQGRKKK